MSASTYEFTAAENATFRGLIAAMKRAALVIASASAILLAYQLVQHFDVSLKAAPSRIAYVLDVVIWCLLSCVGMLIAVLLVRATAGFTSVIETEGDDIRHLMRAIARVRGVVDLIFWTACVGALLLTTSFVLLLTGHA